MLVTIFQKSSASTPRQSRLLSPAEPDLIPHHHRSVLSGDYSTASESDDDKLNRTTSVRRVPSVGGNGVSGPPSATTSSFSRPNITFKRSSLRNSGRKSNSSSSSSSTDSSGTWHDEISKIHFGTVRMPALAGEMRTRETDVIDAGTFFA